MPKVRNTSGVDRTLFDGRFVLDDAVVEVSDEELDGFLCQPDTWALASSAKPRHKSAEPKE